ncbi:MAG: histidine triad nucleotide-binding protein [Oscillospiraceae bacterium]|nr:histidine triad nucleotide-binding protein [Oscillospiraceae bacterium]
MKDCLFCKIIDGDAPAKKVYEDGLCFAFYDNSPQAPTHFLVVPRKHLNSAADITEADAMMVGHCYAVIAMLSRVLGFADNYRVVTNTGSGAGQSVQHLHFHVLAGKKMGPFV